MGDGSAIAAVQETLIRWSADLASPAQVVDEAAKAVAAGVEERWIIDLASLATDASGIDVEDVLIARPPDVSPAVLPRGNADVLVAAAMTQVRRCATGRLSERELTKWAHEFIGHGRTDELEPLVSLDDSYDIAEHFGEPPDPVAAQVRAEVDRLVRQHQA